MKEDGRWAFDCYVRSQSIRFRTRVEELTGTKDFQIVDGYEPFESVGLVFHDYEGAVRLYDDDGNELSVMQYVPSETHSLFPSVWPTYVHTHGSIKKHIVVD